MLLSATPLRDMQCLTRVTRLHPPAPAARAPTPAGNITLFADANVVGFYQRLGFECDPQGVKGARPH